MGYDPQFISGFDIPLPHLAPSLVAMAFDDGNPIEHTRFSIIFNEQRGLAIATAHNIDGGADRPNGPAPSRSFRFDPLVPNPMQVDNDRGYLHNPWDRGHLVRRHSLFYGDDNEAAEAVSQSDFWTNIAPQHENLHDTAWGAIEDWMLELADSGNRRACVFTGPVLTADDPQIVNKPNEVPVQIPAGFWKIIAFVHDGHLKAAAFVTWQRDHDQQNPVDFDPVLEQIRITTLEYLTGLSFVALRTADPLHFGTAPTHSAANTSSTQRATQRTRKTAVTSKEDIFL